ncbi:unnamed protein product [Staurois parvus]|uniref:Uncharacterized protein n=1 Tax=Staurois parvus TaxID=386267 RepID=A0ABN9AUU6_9NEOB|nr:unnamed protein product [Staurois parvus]
MQSGKYSSPGNHQTQTRPLDCQTEKRDSLHLVIICCLRSVILCGLQLCG